MPTGLAVPEFLTHLLTVYQSNGLGEAGEESHVSQLEQLHSQFNDIAEKEAATKAIQHFLDCCKEYLHDHPPQQHFMMAQGFGVELGGGVRVALTGTDADMPEGSLETPADVAVTMPRSLSGQHGISSTSAVAVTGIKESMTVKSPKA